MLLTPEAYGALTPVELSDMLAGAAAREERAIRRVAWQTAALLNIAGKSLKAGVSVTADELMGKKTKVVPKDPGAQFEQLWARVEHLRAKRGADGN